MTINEIIEDLKNKQKQKRFEHSLGVAYTASCLAMRYSFDHEKAFLAGMLHDCAKLKNTTDERYIGFLEANRIEITKAEYISPHLLHAKVGAFFAKNIYEVNDKEILDAILTHVTGTPNMSLLQKIIYVADYIEPQRKFDNSRLKEIRKEAFINIDKAVFMISNDILEHLKNNNYNIDPKSNETYNYYMNEVNDGN